MQVTMKRFGEVTVAGNADQVIFGWAVPSECRVTSIRGQVHVIGTDTNFSEITAYGLHGIASPYSVVGGLAQVDGVTYETIWDRLAPKMADSLNFALSDTAVTEPVYEPGQFVEGSPFDMQLVMSRMIYERKRWLSLANGRAMMQNWVTGAASTYVPADLAPINVRQKIYFPEHGCVMFGLSAPNMAELNAAVSARGPFVAGVAGTNDIELYHHSLKFLGEVLQQALYSALGLVAEAASGASLAADDLLLMLEDLLVHPTIIEGTNAFRALSWHALGEATLQMTVPGSMQVSNVGPEGRG